MKKLEDRRYFEKINKIVDWINKHERQRIERLDIAEDYINALVQDYNRRHKAKGTEDEKHSQKGGGDGNKAKTTNSIGKIT